MMSHAKSWEKELTPGLSYYMEYDESKPLIIHALKIDPANKSLELKPELTADTIFDEHTTLRAGKKIRKMSDVCVGKNTVSEAVSMHGAIGGITGDFFKMTTGDPIGAMLKDRKLYSGPAAKPRGVFGWGRKDFFMGKLKFEGKISWENQEPIKIDTYNEFCKKNGLTLNTSIVGFAQAATPNAYALIKVKNDNWRANYKTEGEVITIHEDTNSLPIKKGYVVLAGRGSAKEIITQLKRGQKINLEAKLEGADWKKITNAIGGGPFLLKNGKEEIDFEGQQFTIRGFLEKRYARCAIGRTKDNKIVLATVDGPSSLSKMKGANDTIYSAGATLKELADIMRKLGCTDAMNLDGGGSATFSLFGKCFNRPSSKIERRVSNLVAIYAPKMIKNAKSAKLKLKGPSKIKQNENPIYKVFDADGKEIENSKLIWQASGSGWIDQEGKFHGITPGKTTIRVYYQGKGYQFNTQVLPEEGYKS